MKDHQIPAAAATAQDAAAARGAVDEPRDDPRVRAIDALLPQTQCRQCGFAGCLPYARALADGQSAINRCPPGGAAGIALLAQHLGQPVIDLDVSCGTHRALQVAQIDESRCIGCTLCIQACPVDAIAGAIKRMHSVLPEACTGCDLCVAPCPMDCIRMVPAVPARDWTRADADRARERLLAREARRIREAAEDDERLAAKALGKLDALEEPGDIDASETSRRRAIIEQALARVGQRRAAAQGRRAPLPGGDPA